MNHRYSSSLNANEIQCNIESVKKSFHRIKASIESIYSNSHMDSFSFDNINDSLANSSEAEKVSKKTKEITDMVTGRLTAFLFMSKLCYDMGEIDMRANDELESLKKSLNEDLEFCKENCDKPNEILVKSLFEEVLNLQTEYENLQNKLIVTREEIKYTEEEEEDLKEQLMFAEKNLNNFIIDTKESKTVSCNCALF